MLLDADGRTAGAWLAAGPAAIDIQDFLTWAAERGHCHTLTVPSRGPRQWPAGRKDQEARRPRSGGHSL